MKKMWFLIVLLAAAVVLAGCNPPKPSAKITTAMFRDTELQSGQSTDLILDAMNDGQVPVTTKFIITAENPDRVKITVQSPLEFTLQPGETMGNKIVKINATTDTVSTSYLVTISLTDGASTILDSKSLILKVNR